MKVWLKAIGIGFLWAIGITILLGLFGIQIYGLGAFAWVVISYKYIKKYSQQKTKGVKQKSSSK